MVEVCRRVSNTVPKNRWIASLSNGETIFEDRSPGLPPAWERLAQYVKENDLSITRLRAEVCGLVMKLPSGQPAYIHKKKVWSTGAHCGAMLCVGYVDKRGNARIDELGSDRSSHTIYCDDPGPPWTIYNKEMRDAKNQQEGLQGARG